MPTYLITACIVLLGSWWIVARMALQLRSEFQAEINLLESRLRALEEGMLEQKAQPQCTGDDGLADHRSIRIITGKSNGEHRELSGAIHEDGQISAETQEAIRATVSALLGREIQLKSVKPVEGHETGMTWITQGRIAIQTSHNQFVSHE